MNIPSVQNLSVYYEGRRGLTGRKDGVWALKGVSLSPPASLNRLSIVGESGSGKTTLLRSLLGLVSPASGSVSLFGKSWEDMNGAEKLSARRACGYIPQDPYGALPPTLSVLGAVVEPWNIVRGRDTREEGLRRAKILLAELKLPEELWNERPRYSLSGGQRQRVAVARALILEPKLLLADEPTAMQDVSTRAEVLEVLNRRVQRGMSIILVTHDLFLAGRAAERIAVLYKGEIVEEGESQTVIANPSHDYTRELLSALPRLGA
ncbi:oligopeptide ABC transporter ATP-binding protein [Synergistales bacterium]|nr:oligopeptide ABC transporter ATP-binding protein [Synergistales bacterium]